MIKFIKGIKHNKVDVDTSEYVKVLATMNSVCQTKEADYAYNYLALYVDKLRNKGLDSKVINKRHLMAMKLLNKKLSLAVRNREQ